MFEIFSSNSLKIYMDKNKSNIILILSKTNQKDLGLFN